MVNADGMIVKSRVPRAEVYLYDDLYMQIVIVAIFNLRGQILVHRRSDYTNVSPGNINLVCGGITSGEDTYSAASREAAEETGVIPDDIRIVDQGINPYNCYRYLLVGTSAEEPRWDKVNHREVSWIGYQWPEELRTKQATGELSFVDGFFDDVDKAVKFRCDPRT